MKKTFMPALLILFLFSMGHLSLALAGEPEKPEIQIEKPEAEMPESGSHRYPASKLEKYNQRPEVEIQRPEAEGQKPGVKAHRSKERAYADFPAWYVDVFLRQSEAQRSSERDSISQKPEVRKPEPHKPELPKHGKPGHGK